MTRTIKNGVYPCTYFPYLFRITREGVNEATRELAFYSVIYSIDGVGFPVPLGEPKEGSRSIFTVTDDFAYLSEKDIDLIKETIREFILEESMEIGGEIVNFSTEWMFEVVSEIEAGLKQGYRMEGFVESHKHGYLLDHGEAVKSESIIDITVGLTSKTAIVDEWFIEEYDGKKYDYDYITGEFVEGGIKCI